MNIYTFGSIGYSEAKRLFNENEELCRARFPEFFIDQFIALEAKHHLAACVLERLKSYAEPLGEATKAEEQPAFIAALPGTGQIYICPLSEGGICRGLWELGAALNCGLKTDVLRIPVDQETVEIMELLGSDPYEACSDGCFLIALPESIHLDSAEDFLKMLHMETVTTSVTKQENAAQNDPHFACIGHTIKGRSRTLKMPEGERYLTPPGRQSKDMAAKKADRVN